MVPKPAGKVQVVVGGQYGSEAKGAVAAYLCAGREVNAVRVAGPNAGHTVIDADENRWALRQIPVAAVSSPRSRLVIAAGSEIDPEVLGDEVERLEAAGFGVVDRLFIDGQATVLEQRHRMEEAGMFGRIGSTAKGVGAARADRVMRHARTWQEYCEVENPAGKRGVLEWRDTAAMLNTQLELGRDCVIEGTQGYALGLHAGWYPYCTSSDCRVVDFLAMAGIQPVGVEIEPWVVLRTYPIRVAGNSGPLPYETSWEELEKISGGWIKPERTTVTQRIRRVGRWDPELAKRAVQANGGDRVEVALSMFDYWYPGIAGAAIVERLTDAMFDQILEVERQVGASVRLIGTGPDTMIDLREGEDDG